MALYQYQCVTPSGKKEEGIINADTYDLAKEKLFRQKILVTKLREYTGSKRAAVLSKAELLHFTRDLSQFLRSGLPLYESLVAIEEKYRSHKNHSLFLDLCDQVKQGKALSAAMRKYPFAFDQIYLSMVSAAEESGTLPVAFQELNKLITRSEKLKKQLISSLIYPAFLAVFCLIVLIGLFFFLIPSMKELFSGRNLHPLTQGILQISQFLEDHALTIVALFTGTMGVSVLYARTHGGRLRFQKLLLKVPFIRRLITEAVILRFSHTLAVLLDNGIPVVEALRHAKKVMNHTLFEEVITRAEKGLMEGKSLSEELAGSPLFPKIVVRMLRVADESGDTSAMLKNISQMFEENMEKTLSRITSLIQPALLLVLGFIVGMILLAVLLPLTDVSSFVE